MLPWNLPSSAQTKPRLTITKKVLWAQPEPILDILLVDSDSQMLVLSPNKVVSYRLTADQVERIGDSFAGAASAVASRPARAAGGDCGRIPRLLADGHVHGNVEPRTQADVLEWNCELA